MRKINKYSGLTGVTVLLVVALLGCGSSGDFNTTYEVQSGGINFTNEYSSPAELGVGDVMYVNFDGSNQAEVNFSGVSSQAKFTLIVGSAADSGASDSIQMAGDLSSIVEKDARVTDPSANIAADNDEYTADEMLSAWLRAAEYEIAATLPPPEAKAIGVNDVRGFKAASVGDTESFRVLSSLTSVSSYTTVQAKVRCIGNAVIFYVDPRVSSDELSDDDISSLCGEFDEVARAEQDLLGEISDVDGDGRLAVIMTPQVNRLGQMGGGIITGYFWAGDLYAQNSSNPVSNYREIIYTMIPDPDGTYGYAVTKEFALSNLLPAVLPHELQHAISYNQHVFVKGSAPEQNWLNEGISHLAEDIMGYGMENPSRYALFLASTASAGLVVTGQPDLYERGAAYLFLRYLYEQAASPNEFIAGLLNTSQVGVSNVEQAFAGQSGFSQFHEFMARWTATLAMTNEGLTQDSRYIYQNRVRDSQTGNWKGVCITCDADDNRGTLLAGVTKTAYTGSGDASVAGSAAKFYSISSVPGTISLAGSSGGSGFGVLIREE